jgi:hypothetical protein
LHESHSHESQSHEQRQDEPSGEVHR